MIVISPYSKALRNGVKPNPKDYPWWPELIELIRKKYPNQTIVQVGLPGEEPIRNTVQLFSQPMDTLKQLIRECDLWISVDNFFHHLASLVGKPGVVLWGQSDPGIFGDPANVNLVKDKRYLREKQFWWWEQASYMPEAFLEPREVMGVLRKVIHG